MTDMIPADAVREIAAAMRAAMRRDEHAYPEAKFLADLSGYIKDLEALLPRPTLADMTDEERRDAVGMWADVHGPHPYRGIIDDIPAPRVPVFKPTAGELTWTDPENVTPRPDLGRAWSPIGTPVAAQDGYTPAELTYIDTAPAPATLTEGSEWDDIGALTLACESSGRGQIVVSDCEGDAFVWGAGAGWWESGTPSDGYEPYTIIHAGKGGDQ